MPNLKIGNDIEYTANKIAENAFYKGINTANQTIELDIPEVNQLAFQDCPGIKTVIIKENVKKIAFNAFKQCINLTTIEVHNNLLFQAGNTNGLNWLKYINGDEEELIWVDQKLPSGWGEAEYSAAVNEMLEGTNSAVIAQARTVTQLKRISPYLFAKNQYINNLVIPTNITSIGYHAFEECNELYNIRVATGRTETLKIEDYAFHKCGPSREGEPAAITLSNAHTTIGNRALAFLKKNGDKTNDPTDIMLNIPVINTPADAPKIVTIHKNAFEPLNETSTISRINIVHTTGSNIPELYVQDSNWKPFEGIFIFTDKPWVHTVESNNTGIVVNRVGDVVTIDFDYIEFNGNIEEATE